MDAYVEMSLHYWSSNFVVMGLVDDEFKGVAEVADVAVEVEIVSPELLFCPLFLTCSY